MNPTALFSDLAISSSPALLRCIAPLEAKVDATKYELHNPHTGTRLHTTAKAIDRIGTYEFTAWTYERPDQVSLVALGPFEAPTPPPAGHGLPCPYVGLMVSSREGQSKNLWFDLNWGKKDAIEMLGEHEYVTANKGLVLWQNTRWHREVPIMEIDLDLSVGDTREPIGDFLFDSIGLELPEGWIAVPKIPLPCHRMEGSVWWWAPPLKDGSEHAILQYRGLHMRVVICPLGFEGIAQSVAAEEGFAIAAHGRSWYTVEGALFDSLRQPLPRLGGDLLKSVEAEVDARHKDYIDGILTGGPVHNMFGQDTGTAKADGLLRDFNPSYGGVTSGVDVGGAHPERAQPSVVRKGLFLSRCEHYWEMTSRPQLHLFRGTAPLTPGLTDLNTDKWNTELNGGPQTSAKVHVITDPWGFQAKFNATDTDARCSYAAWARSRGGVDEEHGGRFRKDAAFLASCGDRIARWHLECRAAMVMLSEPTRYTTLPAVSHQGANVGREDAWNLMIVAEALRFIQSKEMNSYLHRAIEFFDYIELPNGHHECRFNTKYADELAPGGSNYHLLGQATKVEVFGKPPRFAEWYDPEATLPPWNERPGIAQAWEEVLLSNAFLAAYHATGSHLALKLVNGCVHANWWAWDDAKGQPRSHYCLVNKPGAPFYEALDDVPVYQKRDWDNWYLPMLVANGLWAAFYSGGKSHRMFAGELFQLWRDGKDIQIAAGVNGTTTGVDMRWQMMSLAGFFTTEQIVGWCQS